MKKRKEHIRESRIGICKPVLLVLTTVAVQGLNDTPIANALEPLSTTPPANVTRQQQTIQEKVIFQSTGSVIQATVISQPARYCGLFMRTTANPQWTMIPSTRTVTNSSGNASINLDVKTAGKGSIELAIGSSPRQDFAGEVLMTPSFVLNTAALPNQVRNWSANGGMIIVIPRGTFR